MAFYVSGQFLTEDYYVANKLMKGFIGSGNIDTNSRLCMASSVAGHIRAFGEDIVPGCYDDRSGRPCRPGRQQMAWCHPVLHQRLTAARQARGQPSNRRIESKGRSLLPYQPVGRNQGQGPVPRLLYAVMYAVTLFLPTAASMRSVISGTFATLSSSVGVM